MKVSDAADIGREQDGSGLHGAKISRVRDLEIDGGKCAGDAGKEAGEAKGQIANDVGVIANELNALRIVTNGIAHAAERRARQRVHGDDRQQRPRSDQIVDLNLRAETPVEHPKHFSSIR